MSTTRPVIALDTAIVAANAHAWQTFAGVPLRAVVKADGYGWGYHALANALAGIVAAFCVADEDELNRLRRYTDTPAIVLADVPTQRIAAIYAANALPSAHTPAALDAAARYAASAAVPLRVRVGLRPAASWSGLSPDELRAFAPRLARANARVEFWSHVSDWERRDAQARLFREATDLLKAAGVHVVGTDLASTIPLAADGAGGTSVRVGVGLFGATGGHHVRGVRCALRVVAPLTRRERLSSDLRIGYGERTLAAGTEIATARCGYADGLPKRLAGTGDILSIGMQYVTMLASRFDARGQVVFLDAAADLDAFAARAGALPHEIVTAFGNAASARATRLPLR